MQYNYASFFGKRLTTIKKSSLQWTAWVECTIGFLHDSNCQYLCVSVKSTVKFSESHKPEHSGVLREGMTEKETREAAEASRQSCSNFLVCLFFKWRNRDREKHLTLERVGWRPKYASCQPTKKERHYFCALSKICTVALPPPLLSMFFLPDQQPMLLTLFGNFLLKSISRQDFAEDNFSFQISLCSLTWLDNSTEWFPGHQGRVCLHAIVFLLPSCSLNPVLHWKAQRQSNIFGKDLCKSCGMHTRLNRLI